MLVKHNSISNGNETIHYTSFTHDGNIGNVQPPKLIFLLPSLNSLIEVFQQEAGPERLFSAPNLLVNVQERMINTIRCMHCMLWAHRKCVGESND